MDEFRVVESDEDHIFCVVDSDGYPIDYGHFTDRDDAVYVCAQMNTGNYVGDRVCNLCLDCDSCTGQI